MKLVDKISKLPHIPKPLTGAYVDLMGLGTSGHGVTPLNQRDAAVVLEGASSPYDFIDTPPEGMEGFNVGPLDQKYMGLRPEQDVFFIYPNAKGNESYLYGHEMTHASHLTPKFGIGNQGYMPTKNPKYQDESTPGGRENWIAENYRKQGVPEDFVPQERLASMIGQLRRKQDRSMGW